MKSLNITPEALNSILYFEIETRKQVKKTSCHFLCSVTEGNSHAK